MYIIQNSPHASILKRLLLLRTAKFESVFYCAESERVNYWYTGLALLKGLSFGCEQIDRHSPLILLFIFPCVAIMLKG